MLESEKCIGNVEIIIKDNDNNILDVIRKQNTVLNIGKAALCKCLGNQIDTDFDFYVQNLLISDGGVDGSGNPLVVSAERTGMFNTVLLTIPVFSSISGTFNNMITFTSTISSSMGNGNQLSEAALQLADGSLYSITTFGAISKTSAISIIFNWTVSFI